MLTKSKIKRYDLVISMRDILGRFLNVSGLFVLHVRYCFCHIELVT